MKCYLELSTRHNLSEATAENEFFRASAASADPEVALGLLIQKLASTVLWNSYQELN